MTKKIINQNSFTAGELSPRLYGRSDTAEYKNGLEEATNSIITPQGPIKRRNGTRYVAEVKESLEESILVRYQFSQSQAFILEFGNQYIRFFKDSGQVLESTISITDITQANPAVVTTSISHGLSNGDYVYITTVEGMTEINSSTVSYKVNNVTATTFELQDSGNNDIDSSSFNAYTSAGNVNRIYEINSPYTSSQVQDIQYVQNGATLYISHPEVSPRQLVRISDTNWSITELEFSPPPTYESGYENTGVTVTPSATTGTSINFTASGSIWLEADIGRQIINNVEGKTGRASIIEITSGTVAVCDIVEDFTDTATIASADWKLDLSPICDLEIDGIQAGAIVNIRSEYTAGSLGEQKVITGITTADPGVVSISFSHDFLPGERVQINDAKGMTQVNGNIYTVGATTSNTFELKDDNNNNVDTSGFTTYVSDGIARRRLTDQSIEAFRSADVGKYILANGGVMRIISVNTPSNVDVEVIKTLNSDDTTGNWTLESATWNSERGFPKTVGIYQQRLWFAGTDAQPLTVWASESGIFEGYGAGPDDEDAIEVDLDTTEANTISWIRGARDLVIGTQGEEVTLSGSSSGLVTPATVSATQRTTSGSNVQQVSKIGDELIFIDSTTNNLISFRYDFNIDGYIDEEITFLGEHLTVNGLKSLVWAKTPDRLIYAISGDNKVLQGVYDRPKKIIGWSKFVTDGEYEDLQKIRINTHDQVWIIVKRKVNNEVKRYIEFFDIGTGEDDIDGFSDSYLTLSNSSVISNISNTNPAVVTTSTSHGYADDDYVILKGIEDPLPSEIDDSKVNMSSLNNCTFRVVNSTATTFELANLNTTDYNAYGQAGKSWKKVNSVSGLEHLEGKTVQIKTDGSTHPERVVTDGTVNLSTSAGEVVVGLKYLTTIKTLGHEFDIGLGSMQGQRTRWARPLLRVYKSGIPLLNGEFIPVRSNADKLGKKVGLASGYLEYGALNWNNTSQLNIEIDEPLPLEVVNITGSIDGNVK